MLSHRLPGRVCRDRTVYTGSSATTVLSFSKHEPSSNQYLGPPLHLSPPFPSPSLSLPPLPDCAPLLWLLNWSLPSLLEGPPILNPNPIRSCPRSRPSPGTSPETRNQTPSQIQFPLQLPFRPLQFQTAPVQDTVPVPLCSGYNDVWDSFTMPPTCSSPVPVRIRAPVPPSAPVPVSTLVPVPVRFQFAFASPLRLTFRFQFTLRTQAQSNPRSHPGLLVPFRFTFFHIPVFVLVPDPVADSTGHRRELNLFLLCFVHSV